MTGIPVRSKWKFHKAGQGAFYSGIISTRSGHFTFVYDCGTKSKSEYLKVEIDKWHVEIVSLKDNTLDLLVLSHLDDDHVNHVKYLLNKLKKCKIVVLPYLTNIERLYLYFGLDKNNDDGGGIDNDYIRFIESPAQYLSSFEKIEKIIFIRGGGESYNDNILISQPPESGREDNLYVNDRSFKDLDENNFPDEIRSEIAEIKAEYNKVSFCYDNEKIYVSAFWEFYFYNQKNPIANLKAFRNYVARTLRIQLATAGITDELLKDILSKEDKIKGLRTEFKKRFGDMNSPGLVVMHQPVNRYEGMIKIKGKWDHCYPHFPDESSCLTLLNGDIDLKTIGYPNYINERLQYVKVFQVPHHGSDKSWDVSKITNLNRRWVNMIINFGWGNTHGHPGVIVKRDIRWMGRQSYDVTQLKKFQYKIRTWHYIR